MIPIKHDAMVSPPEGVPMFHLQTTALFILTAFAEIVGCLLTNGTWCRHE